MDEKLITLEMEETTESHIDTENTESIVEQIEETTNSHIDVDDIEPIVEQEEVIEYVEVEDVEEVNIEIDETVGWVGGDPSKHYSLSGRDEPNQHIIESITGLREELTTLSSVKDISSIHGGFAEFRQWLDDGYYRQNYSSTGGVGYFVSLVSGTGNLDGNNTYVDICHKKNADGTTDVKDVYGVTVANSGFYGYQNEAYDLLDSDSPNRADNPLYAKVCLLGAVKVRVTAKDHLDIIVGDYVVPNELGYAQKSENDVGFKVISKGQIESVGGTTTAWYYVEIALVPQNDNIARVMKKTEDTQVNLEGITIQLGGMSDKITNIETDIENSKIQLGKDFDGLKDLVNESNKKIDTQLPEMEKKLQEAVEDVVSEASKTINDMTLEYTEAVSKANEVKEAIYGVDGNGGVLKDIKDLQDDIEPLATWKSSDGASSGTVGFLAQAEKDHTELSSLTSAFGENGSDLTAIIQKIDSNGAAIQHIVSHIDKYTLGAHSPAYSLSADEVYILQPGHIYVPTEDHKDEDTYVKPPIEFKLGKSYEWGTVEPEGYMWREYGDVSTSTSVVDGAAEGDLWYCWQGILKDNKYSYDPGTLYRWDNTQKMWLAVASVNDNSTARVTGLIRQTADKLTSVYTDLEGNVSALEQEVDRIGTIVENIDSGAISKIEQTAEDIRLGVYKPDEGSTQLGLLLDGMQSMSNYGGRVCIKHVVDSSLITVNKYLQSPMWNGEEFVFAEGALHKDGIYYPHPTDKDKYCKVVSNGYEVYTIGNEATALLRTEVNNNKSAIEGLTKFETDTSETLTTLTQQSDANSAKIASVAAGEYVVCSDVKELTQAPTIKYKNPPTWKDGKFVFDENDKDTNGDYCMLENDDTHYYKLLSDGKSYEQYELASTGSASIMQMVTKQGSSIGMIVENDKVKASIIAEAINDSDSTVSIKADKINFDGFTKFANTSDLENVKTDLEQIESEAIAKVEVQYALSDSAITAPTSGWNTIAPEWTSDKYMWQKTVVTYANGKVQDGVATCISGAKGADGTGVAIKGSAYINGDVSDDIIGQSFLIYSDEEHITQITSAQDEDAYLVNGYLFVYSGVDDQFICTGKIQGPQGETGANGIGVSEVITQYYLSNSQTELIGDVWSEEQPTWESGKYIWIRNKTTWTDNNIAYTEPILADALNSANETANNANNTANDAKDIANDANSVAQETQASLNARIVDWCVDENTTIIDGAKIATGTILTKNLHTDAIKSLNYSIDESATFSNSGTFFDLANGSITSKKFAIDADGNATIAGRITATSGYIGNGTSGFSIDTTAATRTHTVGEEGLVAGSYYFKHNDRYYQFDVDEALGADTTIVLNISESTITVGDNTSVQITPIGNYPLGSNYLNSELGEGYYYLSNNQLSYNGGDEPTYTKGVYLAPDGIGLGNGNFYVDDLGNLTTNGLISMRSNSKEVLRIENGSIKLSGSISWDVLDNIQRDIENANGTAGEAASLASETADDIYNLAIGEYSKAGYTFINNKSIYSPSIYGGRFTTIDDRESSEARIVIDSKGITSYNSSDQMHGLVSHPNDNISYNDGFSFYSEDKAMLTVARNLNDLSVALYDYNHQDPIGQVFVSSSSNDNNGSVNIYGYWDFTYASVTGLKVTFG